VPVCLSVWGEGDERGCTGTGVCLRACRLINTACNEQTLLSAASLATSYFSTVSPKRHDVREKVVGYEMCILILTRGFISKLSHSWKNSARYCHKCGNVSLESTRYSCSVGTGLFHADRQTEGRTNMKLIVAFRSFFERA
jgi:hypothetical protein